MSERIIMRLLILLFLVLSLVLLIIDLDAQNPKKILCSGKPCNVILIVIDTLGAKHLGIYGYERDTSPFIDSFFSKNSLVFKNAISNATWTNPSFASFLTSRYPSEIPVATWEDKIPEDMPNFVNILRKSGIDVGLQSIDVYKKVTPADKSVFRESERTITEQNLLFLSASEWLINQKAKNSRFFLMIHNWTVHSPYTPPAKYRNLFTEGTPSSAIFDEELNNAQGILWEAVSAGKPIKQDFDRFQLPYDQEIRNLDDRLKDFIESIPKDILDKSIVILTADHGEAFGEHNYIMHNIRPYQEVIHIPLLIHTPDQANSTIDLNVSLLDLAPTILDVYGLNSPKEFKGASLWKLITNEKSKRRILKSEFNKENSKVEAGILGNWKLFSQKSELELYNLKNDPEEKNNLINRLGEIKDEEKKFVDLLFNEFGIAKN